MTFPITLIFMFLVFWRPQEWLLPWLWGWPLLDAITYGALLSLVLEINQGAARIPKTPVAMLAAGLWVATVVSHVVHTYFQGVLNTAPETFKFCFFTFLLVTIIDRPSRVQAVVGILVLCAAVMAVHCLLQQKRGYGFGWSMPMFVFKPATGEWQLRSQFYGIFGDPNDAGQFLATAIPLIFAWPKRMNPLFVVGGLGLSILLFQGLVSTHSRGAMVGFVAEIVTLAFLALPARKLPYLAVVGLVAGLVLCRFGGAMLDPSARERVVFWGYGNQAFKTQPIFGVGYNMFWQVAHGRAAHNAFVTCYTEVGLFGYWFWFSLLQLSLIGCWRVRMAFQRPRNAEQAYLRRASAFCIVAMAGFAASGYFLSRAFVFPFFFFFGLLNAIPLVAQNQLPRNTPPFIEPKHDVFAWGTVATLGSVVYVYLSILLLNKAYGG